MGDVVSHEHKTTHHPHGCLYRISLSVVNTLLERDMTARATSRTMLMLAKLRVSCARKQRQGCQLPGGFRVEAAVG